MLGTWLPLALSDLLRALCGPSAPTLPEVLRRWSLDGLADRYDEAATDAALGMFAAAGREVEGEGDR